jgi:hypothetical protein
MNVLKLLFRIFFSLFLAMPIGGFFFGFVHAQDCAWWNFLGRGFIGLVVMVLTPLFFGFPPQNEGGVGEPFNAWPYIFVCYPVVFWLWSRVIRGRKKPAASDQKDIT